ncbi:phage tail protein [Sorangium sp. So ce1128]
MPEPILLTGFRFRVVLEGGGGAAAGFAECSGLEVEHELFEYAEGGENRFVHRLPTRLRPADLVLRRGLMVVPSELWAWIEAIGTGTYQRRGGEIRVYSVDGARTQAWRFDRGLPVRWSGPELSATQSAVAMESLTIAHEGLQRAG